MPSNLARWSNSVGGPTHPDRAMSGRGRWAEGVFLRSSWQVSEEAVRWLMRGTRYA
jgi:hypothetical protein